MKLRVATRGSELALWQANHVKAALEKARAGVTVELLVLKTTGDMILDRPLSKVGGKGLFVKEIEEALLDGRAEVAVHSMKDVPAELAPGLMMAAISEREDPRDAMVARGGLSLATLPQGARVGTSSLRRVSQLRALRPDFDIQSLRGNVPTRVRKMDDGEFDAVVLAAAGLKRLGMGDRISQHLEPEICLPACGQGALGIETRVDQPDVAALVKGALHHDHDATCVSAERAFLKEVGGGCQLPIAGYATLQSGGALYIRALVGDPQGHKIIRVERRARVEEAMSAGVALARELLDQGGRDILTSITAGVAK